MTDSDARRSALSSPPTRGELVSLARRAWNREADGNTQRAEHVVDDLLAALYAHPVVPTASREDFFASVRDYAVAISSDWAGTGKLAVARRAQMERALDALLAPVAGTPPTEETK